MPAIVLTCHLFASVTARAQPLPKTLQVPGNYATIQEAINATSSSVVDTVLVGPGVYNEAVQLGVKPTRLISTDGPAVTFIVAPSGQAAVFLGEGTSKGVLCGFTLSNSAAGVKIASGLASCPACPSPTIISNIIVNCGTGIDCQVSSPTISYNSIFSCSESGIRLGGPAAAIIEGNLIQQNGIGINMLAAGSPTIRNNIVRGNSGSGIFLSNDFLPTEGNVSQNLVVNNGGHGIFFGGGTRGPWIMNNTVAGNTLAGLWQAASGPDVRVVNNIVVGNPALFVGNNVHPPKILFNNFYSRTGPPVSGVITNLIGIDGNASTDPFFVCEPGGDFQLLPASPLIDAGTNGAALLSAFDLDGKTRIVTGRTNGDAIVDLGAFEFEPLTASSACFFFVCPSNLMVMAEPGQDSTAVYYPTLFATPGATVTYSPDSGSNFALGDSLVNVSVQFGTNATNCTFGVTVVPYNEFSGALNATNLPCVSFGDTNWFVQSELTYDGISAAKSSISMNSQSSTLRTVLAGPGQLSFWWKFYGFPGCNLSLTVDGVAVANVGSITDWQHKTIDLAPGPHIVDWKLSRGSISFWPAEVAAWLDQVSFPSAPIPLILICPTNRMAIADPGEYSAVVNYPPPFATPGATVHTSPASGSAFPAGDNIVNITANHGTNVTNCSFTVSVRTANDFPLALNNSNTVWTTSGNASWYMQPYVTLDGLAIQSGVITNGQIATVETTFEGPGVLTYWWKVSSQISSDLLFVTLNGSTQAVVSGQVDWQQRTVYAGSGSQVFQWSYAKDAVGSTGQDAGWLDQIAWSPGAVGPSVEIQPASITVGIGMSPIFSVTAAGTPPLTYQWLFNGQSLPGATNSFLVISNAQATNVGTYAVQVMNQVGTNVSANATLDLTQVLAWGDNTYGQTNVPAGLANVTAIAGGWHHSVILSADGTVTAWGSNDSGQTNVPAGLSNVVAIASRSGNHSMALRADGSVVVWGNNSFGQTNVPSGLSNVVAISAGNRHCLALKSDGTAVSWGFYANVPAGLSNVVAVSAGDGASLFLRGDGTVVATGTSVPANLTNIIAIAAGGLHYLALRADGTVIAWGNNSVGQTTVPIGLNQVVDIAAGNFHSMALRADGTVVVWGRYFAGRAYILPVLPDGLANVRAIAAGSDHDLVFFRDGSLPTTFKLLDAGLTGGSFSASVLTENGRVYRLEYKSSLSNTVWTAVQWIAGNGTNQMLRDPTSPVGQRFYRVSRW